MSLPRLFIPTLLLAAAILPAWGAPFEVDAVKGLKEFPDPLEVTGVVTQINATQGVFALVDRSTCSQCPTPGCGPFTLPVRWKGPMPAQGKAVLVRGAVRMAEGKRFLFAETVTLLEP